MDEQGAKKGDQVKVLFHRSPFIRGIITHAPLTTEDSWVIVTKDGTICNVKNYVLMRVESRKANLNENV